MPGTVEQIHLAPEREGAVHPVEEVVAEAGRGLVGDRFHDNAEAHDITLIEAEALTRLRDEHGIDLGPGGSRRQVTVSGVDLGALVGRRFRVGDLVCEGQELCEPCNHLVKITGEPGVLRGLVHTGLCAAIVEGGTLRVGDAVVTDA